VSLLELGACNLQVYGYQSLKNQASSEQILGRLARESGQQYVLGTKFFTVSLPLFPSGVHALGAVPAK
jgi:aryl-alcohol dehydrogenase-like predicted oxidoreductase